MSTLMSLVLVICLGLVFRDSHGQIIPVLRENYYSASCPNVEGIVRSVVDQKFQQTFVTVPATLRLFFHDCFIQGCDASVMIASTPNNVAEKDCPDNLSLAGDGFDTVSKAKLALEADPVCKGKVSCADILALATRDVIVLSGGPYFNVELGRLDGRVSTASSCEANLPKASFNLDQLLSNFLAKGLDLTDVVALSAAHTLGFSHCNQFSQRIYGTPPDPTLDATYADQLRGMCPVNVNPTIAIDMDPTTPRTFDNAYYQNLQNHKGLFTSDQVLFEDLRSRGLVEMYASNTNVFNEAFKVAMRKLGRVGVKTGIDGEIRLDCSRIN